MSALTTLTNVKDWLGIPATNTQSDAQLSRLIQAASEHIELWMGRRVLSAVYNELRDGNGASRMRLREPRVTAVSQVIVDGRVIAPSVAGSTGFIFSDTSVVLVNAGVFTEGLMNIQFGYTAGYATVPPDIEQACIEMVSTRHKERERIGVSSKSIAGETISFSLRDMSDSAKMTLAQYRKVVPV